MRRDPASFILRIAGCAALIAVVLTSPAGADSEKPALDALVRQLGQSDWSARQSAEDAIVALGAPAVDSIQAALDASHDVEVRERLRSALLRIGRDELMGPTLVTLDGTYARPADLFDELARAVGLVLDYETDAARPLADAPRPITLALRNEPWLSALAQATTRTGINVRVDETRLVLLERPRTDAAAPIMFVSGAVALRVDSALQRRMLDLVTDVGNASTTLSFSVLVEPKLRLRTSAALMVNKLRDEADRDLIDPRNRRVQLTPSMRSLFNGGIALLPQPGATRIAAFEGDLLLEVITRSTVQRIGDLASLPASVNSVGGEIIVDALARTTDGWELQLRLPYTARATIPDGDKAMRDPAEAVRVLGNDSLKVFDQNGKPVRVGAPELIGIDTGLMVRITLKPEPDTARPTSIEWTLPTQARQVRQPFKLADLPLP